MCLTFKRLKLEPFVVLFSISKEIKTNLSIEMTMSTENKIEYSSSTYIGKLTITN